MNVQGLRVIIFLALGAVLGVAYLCALKWNVRLYCDRSRMALACALHALRLLGAAALLVLAARTGAAPLLAALAGFQLARIFVIRAHAFPAEAAS